MKTLFCLGGLVWAFGLTQAVQAIPVANTVSVTDGAKLEAYAPAKADLAVLAATIHATQVARVNAANRLLASIVPAHGVAPGGDPDRTPDYTPVTVIRNPNLNDPTVSTRRPFLPQPSPVNSAKPHSVPDGGTTAGLLGMALGGAVLLKKKLAGPQNPI